MIKPARTGMLFLLIIFLTLVLVDWGEAEGQPAEEDTSGLTIRVVGLESERGRVAIALFASELNYEREADPFREAFVEISNRRCEWEVGPIPAGEYAVLLYHDLNGNQKLDKNFFGIPREPYGISNNPKPRFGTPEYTRARFEVAGPTVIEVKLQGGSAS